MNTSIIGALCLLLIVTLLVVVVCRKMTGRKGSVLADIPFRTRKKARIAMMVVGAVSMAAAVMGLWYNASTLFADFSDLTRELDIPYFYPAFYIMSGLCLLCYISLLICGLQFLRSRANLFRLFVGTVIFEVLYFFAIGILWMIPGIGMSVGAATGVANGGLTFQAVILFPLWAPFLAGWARKRISEPESPSSQGIQPAS